MSSIRKPTLNNPDLDDLMDELRNEIFANMNCMQIGKIESVNLDEQTAEIQIQFKRRVNSDEIIEYPLLVDCPFVVLQGSGAYLEMPINEGSGDEFCLVFFNDRDIDDWWSADNYKEPRTTRKHSLSDGIALFGINSKNSAIGLEGGKVKLNATGFPLEVITDKEVSIESEENILIKTAQKNVTIETTNGTMEINGITGKFSFTGNLVDLLGASESFMKGNTWQTNWTTFNATVQTATSGSTAQNAAGITTIKSAFATFAAQLSNMLSTTIKGE